MNTRNFASLIVLLLTLSYSSISHAAVNSLCQKGVYVFFGNGVWNDAEDRAASKRLLIKRLEERIKDTALEGKVKYGLAVNPSSGYLTDLFEAYLQNTGPEVSQFWRFLSNLDSIPDYFRNKL